VPVFTQNTSRDFRKERRGGKKEKATKPPPKRTGER
jgi:hypothetical protein